MAFLKKINSDWKPTEKPDLEVDEIFDFPGPIEVLVRSGMALLVDKDGNEIELPGQTFECPICFAGIEGLAEFNAHVSSHMPKPKEVEEAEVVEEDKPDETKEEKIRANRLAALEKARAAKAAKVKKSK